MFFERATVPFLLFFIYKIYKFNKLESTRYSRFYTPPGMYGMNEKEKQAWNELEKAWNLVANDRTHGAAELLRSALQALRQFLDNVDEADYGDIDYLMNELANLRNDMAGFSNCVRLLNNESIESLIRSVTQLQEYLASSSIQIAHHAVSVIQEPAVILTNSRSSVVEQVLIALYRAGKVRRIIQLESRPAYEGRRNAERLIDCGMQVTVIPDAALGYWMHSADAVVVGADAISANGNFLGKIGCYPIAVLAHKEGIPYYVAAERLKFVHDLADEKQANRKFSGDVIGWGVTSDRLALSNIIFEKTYGHLVTGYITEYGLQRPPMSVLETLSF